MAVNSLPSSTSLLDEINTLAPGRDKRSDGTIGDAAHRQSVSDHNPDETGNTGGVEDTDGTDEVHARDIDATGPWPASWSMERIVQTILARCRSGAEKRLRYVIYNRRIWSASSGWAQKTYTGASPHTEHAHFSFRYGNGASQTNPENITAPWGILAAYEEDSMPTAAEIAKELWAYKIASPALGVAAKPAGDWLKDAEQVSRELATLGKALTTAVTALATKNQVDEQALAAALAPGVAAAVVALLPADRDDITAEELQEAIAAVVRDLFSPQLA